jgi:hypothetical protein
MFTEDISRIATTWKEVKNSKLGCNCFPYTMKGKGSVPLMKFGMGNGRGVYN